MRKAYMVSEVGYCVKIDLNFKGSLTALLSGLFENSSESSVRIVTWVFFSIHEKNTPQKEKRQGPLGPKLLANFIIKPAILRTVYRRCICAKRAKKEGKERKNSV